MLVDTDSDVGNSLADCLNNCYDNGVCRNYTCYCNSEFNGEDCSLIVDDLENGMALEEAKYYLYGGLFIGLISGFLIVRNWVHKSNHREYMKFDEVSE